MLLILLCWILFLWTFNSTDGGHFDWRSSLLFFASVEGRSRREHAAFNATMIQSAAHS